MNEKNAQPRMIHLRGYKVDLQHHALLNEAGAIVELRPQALDLLCLLASKAGQVMEKQELLTQVWKGVFVTDDSLVQAIGDIRRAIEDQSHQIIRTVPRRGYRLIEHRADVLQGPDQESTSTVSIGSDLTGTGQNATDIAVPEHGSLTDQFSVGTSQVQSLHESKQSVPKISRIRLSVWGIAVVLLGVVIGFMVTKSNSVSMLSSMRGKLPDRPAIAVLAFNGADAVPGQNLLGIGFAEDLITELARNPDLVVLAPNTSFSKDAQEKTEPEFAKMYGIRYLVEGSIRREGTIEIVNAQLVDGLSGNHVWAQRFEFSAADVYKAQSALVAKIAGSVLSEIREIEKSASLRKPPANLDAYELTLRGLAHKHQLNKAGMVAGRLELERAIELDPDYAPAHVYLGYLNAIDAGRGLSGALSAKDQATAEAHIRRGIELDPNLAIAYQALGVALSYQGRFNEQLEAARRSVELGPGDADNLNFLGYAQQNLGLYEEAVSNFSHAIDLNPVAPAYYLLHFAEALYGLKQFERASKASTQCAQRAPGFPPCYTIGIAADMERGAIDDARSRTTSLLQHIPKVTATVAVVPTMLAQKPNELAHFLDSLRSAGVPD